MQKTIGESIMDEATALSRMVAPGTPRPTKWRQGCIQIVVTRACDKACYHCTQSSNLAGKVSFMTPDQFETAVLSLKGYYGVIGTFGGNPATSKYFGEYCEILKKHVPFEQRGLWCNNPVGKAKLMRGTFNPAVSNLNVHMDSKAYNEFRWDWPESMPFGLGQDSRHSPVHLAMMDVIEDEGQRWELISKCSINQLWSAGIGLFRGELRAFFCEVAFSQSHIHENDPSWPDLGIPLPQKDGEEAWWRWPMTAFREQVNHACHRCGVPMNLYGELSQEKDGVEQTSPTHADVFQPKRLGRRVEVVTQLEQLGTERVGRVIDYLKNAKR